jgi:hypothetical protein
MILSWKSLDVCITIYEWVLRAGFKSYHFAIHKAKIRNKFVSPYPTDPVKIGRLKFFYCKFAVTFFSFLSFRSKFALLKIPYFRFVSPKDRYFHIIEHIFVIKEKKSLPTFQNCGLGKGKLKYF